jgi:hypothetical protein
MNENEVRKDVVKFYYLQTINDGVRKNVDSGVTIKYLEAIGKNRLARVYTYCCPLCDAFIEDADIWADPAKSFKKNCPQCKGRITFEMSKNDIQTLKDELLIIAKRKTMVELKGYVMAAMV